MLLPKSARRRLLIALSCAAIARAVVARAEPRHIDLQTELAAAAAVSEVTILEYMDDKLWVAAANDPFIRVELSYSANPNWNPKPFIDSEWMAEQERTGLWPPIGSKVLIVINGAYEVSLFAQHALEGYRFWSPQITGSTALFECAPPAAVIQPVNSKEAYYKDKSWEGCLLPAANIPWKDLSRLAPASRIKHASANGWELYSWHETGQWVFALLPAVGRSRLPEEIDEAKIYDVSKVRDRLASLAEGERVSWQSPKPAEQALNFLERPPKHLADQMLSACTEFRLNCEGLSY